MQIKRQMYIIIQTVRIIFKYLKIVDYALTLKFIYFYY